MSFAPDIDEKIARARADLRMGLPVIIEAGEEYIAFAAETIPPDRLKAFSGLASETCIAITARRAETLKAMCYDGDVARIALPHGAELSWVHAMANPADDLKNPMKGPFTSLRGGDPAPHRAAIGLLKAARLLPAALVAPYSGDMSGLARLPLRALDTRLGAAIHLDPIVSARLPLEVSEAGRLHVLRPKDGGEEHYAVEIGRPDRSKPVLSRLHSACFTGDLLGSLKCDCGPQLRGALAQMGTEGAGVLLYLNQEGRGIGLANKMRAYSLQDQGFDTVEANHRLGFEDDERDFRLGADILRGLGFSQVRLLTNNPAKIDMMNRCGIEVTERVPLKVGHTHFNENYLATKAKKSGHLL